jgi:long-chain acyl-CoA synthetase
VAIAMRNLPEWIVAYGAALSVGAVVVSLNAWWSEEELDYALNDSTPRVVVADPERARRTAAAASRLGAALVVARAGSDDLPPGALRLEDVVARNARVPEVALEPDDDATILYTSGTTGRPKGAVSTHRAVTQALAAFGCGTVVEGVRRGRTGPSGRQPVFILIVPLFHVTGCIPVMLSCVAVGLKLVMMRRWDPELALGLIEAERVTNLIGVPTQSWDLVESPHFAEYDTSSLRSVAGGGAPAPPALVRRVEASFARGRPTIGYGMTETNAYGPANHGDDYLTHPTSAGRALPIVGIEIRDEAGRARPVGESGEIWMKGPHIIRGYWNKPEETAEAIVDGWLATGDIGRLDGDGFIYVEDRAKDVVLRGGENVYCAEVEAALYEHPAVNEAAVLGRPHPRLGEEVVAVVVVRPGHSVTSAELQEHVAARLAAFKVPADITVTDQRLPRSPTGKILKRELRRAP